MTFSALVAARCAIVFDPPVCCGAWLSGVSSVRMLVSVRVALPLRTRFPLLEGRVDERHDLFVLSETRVIRLHKHGGDETQLRRRDVRLRKM